MNVELESLRQEWVDDTLQCWLPPPDRSGEWYWDGYRLEWIHRDAPYLPTLKEYESMIRDIPDRLARRRL